MSLLKTPVLALALAYGGCTSESPEEPRVWENESLIVELVELSPANRKALLAAPEIVMHSAPSEELSSAIRVGSVESIKVQLVTDKVDGKIVDTTQPTYQGWIYYTSILLADGKPYTPAALCVSQSEKILWSHCQDMSDNVTERLARNRLRKQAGS